MGWGAVLASTRPTALGGSLQRLVESQEQVATNRLVDSLADQSVLEEMLEATKPALRPGTEGLHYLLATPFRYPPLKFGSRFGTRAEPSLFYGSLETPTLLAEAAYYRFVFWHGMVEPPPRKIDTQHTRFGADYRTERGLRLQDPPFTDHARVLTDRAQYGPTQALGAAMRAAGIEAFEYRSARDPEGGINVALFRPRALAVHRPVFEDRWLCELTAEQVRFHAVEGRDQYVFSIGLFEVDGRLPWPP